MRDIGVEESIRRDLSELADSFIARIEEAFPGITKDVRFVSWFSETMGTAYSAGFVTGVASAAARMAEREEA